MYMPNDDFSIKTGINVDDSGIDRLKNLADSLTEIAKSLDKIGNGKVNLDISGLKNIRTEVDKTKKQISELANLLNKKNNNGSNKGKLASIEHIANSNLNVVDPEIYTKVEESLNNAATAAAKIKDALGGDVSSGLLTQINEMLEKKDELLSLADILKSNKDDINKVGKAAGNKAVKYTTDKSYTGDLKYLINTEAEAKILNEYRSDTAEFKRLKEERKSVLSRTNGKSGNNSEEKNLEQKLENSQKTIAQNVSKYGDKIKKAFADMDSLKTAKQNIDGMNEMFTSGYQDITKWASAVASGSMSIETFQSKVGKLQNSLNNVYKVIDNPSEGTAEIELQNFLKQLSGLNNIDFGKTNIKNGLATLSGSFKDVSGNVQTLTAQLDLATGAISRVATSSKPAASGIDKFFSGWKSKMANLAQYITSFQAMSKIWDAFKQGLNVVKDFDTALTEMRKVSDEPINNLKNFQKESFDIANSLGTTALQIQNSTADFLRLGETFSEAKESATNANKLLNVSEFDNIEDATSALISMKSAFKEVAESDLVDKVNQVGVSIMPKHMVTCGEFLYSL